MVWLFLPPDAIRHARKGEACAEFPSAPELVASTSDSTSPIQDTELWLTSNGKPTQRPRSWRGWKMRPWISLLSGTMLPASTADRGADWWISCMAATRASHFLLPAASSAIKTRAISGRTSNASFQKSSRPSASSKTSADIYDWASSKSTMTFDQWVIALRRGCLQRRKSARHTGENGFSSWLTPRAQETSEKQDTFVRRNDDRTDRCFGSLTAQTALWPTMTATDGNKGGPNSRHGSGSLHLPAAAVQQQWYTPNVPNGGRVNPKEMSPTGAMPNGKKRQVGLENQAIQVWPTPMANPNSNRQTKPTPSQLKGEHGLNLAMVAVTHTWPTPRACSGKRSSGANRTELTRTWATPQARDYRSGEAHRWNDDHRTQNLNDQVAWATPTTRDWKDGAATANVQTNCLLGRQAPRSMSDGTESPLTLNPLFVEWLMGWPIGWTDCGSAVTALSRWLPRMRSELSRMQPTLTDEQFDLFS